MNDREVANVSDKEVMKSIADVVGFYLEMVCEYEIYVNLSPEHDTNDMYGHQTLVFKIIINTIQFR